MVFCSSQKVFLFIRVQLYRCRNCYTPTRNNLTLLRMGVRAESGIFNSKWQLFFDRSIYSASRRFLPATDVCLVGGDKLLSLSIDLRGKTIVRSGLATLV